LKERGDGYIRVSFRSRNGLDVGKVAAGLGGGGHKYASGATVQGALEETADRVVAVLTEALTKKNL
jgi:phosphoesterase RecJ-like protein